VSVLRVTGYGYPRTFARESWPWA